MFPCDLYGSFGNVEQEGAYADQLDEGQLAFFEEEASRYYSNILASPTYEYRMFPPMAAALDELGRKKVVRKKAFRFGSYGWSGGAQKEFEEIAERFRLLWDFAEPYEFAGAAAGTINTGAGLVKAPVTASGR